MKAFYLLLFSAFCVLLSAQSHPNQTEIGFNQDCEDLVFNTRELTGFAYNTKCKTESYPFLSSDGLHLYYTNNQSYDWLFYSHKDSNTLVWSVPIPLNIASFSNPIRSCYVTDDFLYLYFISTEGEIYKSESINASFVEFGHPEKIEIVNLSVHDRNAVLPFSCLSFTDDMNQMIAFTGSFNQPSMASYIKTSDNTYTFKSFITEYKNEMGVFADNGLSYYFVNKSYKNILFSKKRNSIQNEFSSEIYQVKAFESNLQISQLRISKNGDMVLVLSEDLWNKNDIYFLEANEYNIEVNQKLFNASNFISGRIDSKDIEPILISEKAIPEKLNKVEIISHVGSDICKIEIGLPFPNPAKNQFYIYYHVSGENEKADLPNLVLVDHSGRIVHTQRLDKLSGEIMVVPEHVKAGIYFIRIDYNGLSSTMSKITLNL